MSEIIASIKGKAVLAPLAGISNLPFRLINRSFGCPFAFTEMISANGLIRNSSRTFDYLKSSAEDKHLGVQIFGADPQTMAQAARLASAAGAQLIDINMGCPVRKVVKTGSGAALMNDPVLAGRIIEAVVKATDLPVTVKIRSGWRRSSINAVEMARTAEREGASAVIIHARTAEQGFSGVADWSIISQVKNELNVPVIGNGDIREPSDAIKMMETTGCDAVMIARGALGNPWIFSGINKLLAGGQDKYLPNLEERLAIINLHWEKETGLFGEKIAEKTFRKHLLWYTRGLKNSAQFRKAAGACKDKNNLADELNRYFNFLRHLPPDEDECK